MNPCKDCIVDMICIKKCPMFTIDIKRLQTDELVYLKRCMNNIWSTMYKKQLSNNVTVYITNHRVMWYKNGKQHRDNDQPAIIWDSGSQHWYKYNKLHRDNDQPAIIRLDGTQRWYKNGKIYKDNDFIYPTINLTDKIKLWFKKWSPL